MGVAAATNDVGTPGSPDKITAVIDNSTVNSAAGVSLTANNTTDIEAITIAGSVSVGGSEVAAVSFGAAGAGSKNTTYVTTQAMISGGSHVSSAASQDITLAAFDSSTITANGGGVGISAAGGGFAAVSVGLGAAVAYNTIHNVTTAAIDGSTATSAGRVDLSATSTANIKALAVGVGVSLAGGGGVAIAGAGSGGTANNTITDATQAYIQNGSTVSAAANGANGVNLAVQDNASILANTAAVSVALGLAPIGGALAVGTVTSTNTIGNTDQAYIGNASGNDATVVTSGGGVTLAASSASHIDVLGIAVAAAVSTGIGLAGSGAIATNTTTSSITAAIQNGTVHANGGQVNLTAQDQAIINADVGTGALSPSPRSAFRSASPRSPTASATRSPRTSPTRPSRRQTRT